MTPRWRGEYTEKFVDVKDFLTIFFQKARPKVVLDKWVKYDTSPQQRLYFSLKLVQEKVVSLEQAFQE